MAHFGPQRHKKFVINANFLICSLNFVDVLESSLRLPNCNQVTVPVALSRLTLTELMNY